MTGVSPSPPTYPRSYDLLHADHLFSKLKPRLKKGRRKPKLVELPKLVKLGLSRLA